MKTLGSVKVKEQTIANIKKAIEKYNQSNLVAITEAEFRRLALELLSQLILQNSLKKIPIKLQSV